MSPTPSSDASISRSGGESTADLIPVVGLGGSAGSIEALQDFFKHTRHDSGMAFVVILHLAPDHESTLAAILQRVTSMPVQQVNTALRVEPNHVYVIPPGHDLTMIDGEIGLSPMDQIRGRRSAVDIFFRTLADTYGALASGIVLSGLDSDGALGMKRIKERGGLTIAQDPDEAGEPSMPEAAIGTGTVDWVLRVAEMPERLIKFHESGRCLRLPEIVAEDKPAEEDETVAMKEDERAEEALREVLEFLRVRSGHNFSSYKRATIIRRIARRMQVNGCENMPHYLEHLRTHVGEAMALLQDLLISVTNFFRDHEVFAALEETLPEIFRDKDASDHVRVWVPACATGEEAHSIAMLLSEYASQLDSPPQIQIFATDIDQAAIEIARSGFYPETIKTDVSDERLKRFFTKEATGYRVRRSTRELVLFAMHDLLKDPPFSRMDLVSCRNLLIYLNREAQALAFDIFHFALHQDGRLMLGSSETAEEAGELFKALDKKHRIYSRKSLPGGVSSRSRAGLAGMVGNPGRFGRSSLRTAEHNREPHSVGLPIASHVVTPTPFDSMGSMHFRLVDRIMPPSVVINQNHDVVHLSNDVGGLLRIAGGAPTMNLLRVVHPSLRTELRAALFRAQKHGENVKSAPVSVEIGSEVRSIRIEVYPGGELANDLLLVVFPSAESDVEKSAAPASPEPLTPAVLQLEEELDQLRSQWHDSVEQYETSTAEVQASNEELQAMNEELRSTTEELETGREELQSVNEELSTVNLELKSNVEELSRTNNDLQNLMASTDIATIFLDRDLRIKRFTPSALAVFNLIPADIGRPLSDLTHHLDYSGIEDDARRVLERLSPVEREVRSRRDGWFGWFLIRVLPYRTIEDHIGGVVLTCIDITERKKSDEEMRWLSMIVESSNDSIISFTLDGEILSWNLGSERIFGYTSNEMIGRSMNLLEGSGNERTISGICERLRRGDPPIDSLEATRLRKDGVSIDVSISASLIRDEEGEIIGATAIGQDITFRKQALEELRKTRDELENRVAERTDELHLYAQQIKNMAAEMTRGEQRERSRMAHLLHDHVQQLLVSAKMRLERIKRGKADISEVQMVIDLLEETLDESRSLGIDLSPPVLKEGLPCALEWLGAVWMAQRYELEVELDLDPTIDAATDELCALVFIAVKEILFNVVKHAGVKDARLRLAAADNGTLDVTIGDHGKGFDLEILKLRKAMPTSGMGLASLGERLELAGGSLNLRSGAAKGFEALITIPAKTIKPE